MGTGEPVYTTGDAAAPADRPPGPTGVAVGEAALPTGPNSIVEGMASARILGRWRAEPTDGQRKAFAGHQADPSNAPEGQVVPPSPDAIASSTMTFTDRDITVTMPGREMVDRYVILEDGEHSLVYRVVLGAGAGGPEGPDTEGERLRATFETDDRILVQPDGVDGFDITFVRDVLPTSTPGTATSGSPTAAPG